MSAKKEKPKHLGRGLQSLLGPITKESDERFQTIPLATMSANLNIDKGLGDSLQQVSLSDIQANPYQPRSDWGQQELEDLASSIKSNGVIQPVIVRPFEKGYQLIAGERRFRAAKLVPLETIPAIVRDATDEQLLELALIENIQRTNLNPIERANAYKNYLNSFSLTQSQASQRLGENRSVIANHLRLLDLPTEIKQMLINKQLSMGHARAILSLPTDNLRRKLANRAYAGRLNVREVERLVRKYLVETDDKRKPVTTKQPHIIDLENKLTGHLGTKVCIETRKTGKRGKIIIEFYSIDEFDRITKMIGKECLEEM